VTPLDAERVVARVVRHYARKCWWADADDLRQVGREAALKARRTFVAACGVPEEAYVKRAVQLAIRHALWAESAPVSGGMRNPWATRRGLRRAPIENVEGDPLLPCRGPGALSLLSERRWVELARERIESLTDGEACALGLRVLLGERAPSEVAREAGVTRGAVYESTSEVRRRLLADRDLWMLVRYKEKEGEDT
jgi:hypothetical protein